jgi:predicted small lipoprotein YifL
MVRIAGFGLLLLCLSLAGCGRKGGLDAPPASSLDEQMLAAPAAQIGPDGQPLPAAAPPPRRTWLDWLID